MEAIFWLGLVIVLLIIEALTMGLTTIWFAGGAMISFLVALVGGSIPLQAGAFLVVSTLLLVFTRPAVAKFMNRKVERTNVDSFIGRHAVVTEQVDNLKGTGCVLVSGVDWTARSCEESLILEEGQVVRILRVDGVKLIVDKKTEE